MKSVVYMCDTQFCTFQEYFIFLPIFSPRVCRHGLVNGCGAHPSTVGTAQLWTRYVYKSQHILCLFGGCGVGQFGSVSQAMVSSASFEAAIVLLP